MKSYYKISFIGDIMCEEPLQKASFKKGSYDFTDVFSEMYNLFAKSDAVIGNLETVFAGKEESYTHDLYSFNTPDSFLIAMQKAGITHVSTANNHCLDRGTEGIIRTIDKLDEVNIKHFGTYKNSQTRSAYERIILGDIKIGLIGYTFGTNVYETHIVLTEDKEYMVNMLKSQAVEMENWTQELSKKSLRFAVSRLIRKGTSLKQRMQIKRILGIPYKSPTLDELEAKDICEKNIQRLKNDIHKAKAENDYVIFCLHSGGTFNKEVGSFTEHIVKILKDEGVNAIIGNHPHIVQKSENSDECLVAFSLGNFSLSPSSIYVIHDELPEYSVMPHFYFDKTNGQLQKTSFSILKIIEDKSGKLIVWPVDQLGKTLVGSDYKKLIEDISYIYSRFMQSNYKKINLQEEYLWADIQGENT